MRKRPRTEEEKEKLREYNRIYALKWYHSHPKRKRVLTPSQKAHKNQYMREWHAKHPGYQAAQHQKHYDPAKKRAHYLKNREAIDAQNRAWQKRNPEKVKAFRKKANEKMRREKPEQVRRVIKDWKIRNREHCREVNKIWRKKNLARFRIKQVDKSHRRRARERAEGHENCREKIKALHRERFCRYCCIALTPENFTVDHIIPLSRGGQHKPDNLAAACDSCNSAKGTKLVHEWTWKEAA